MYVSIYLGIYYYSSKILLPGIFWGFHDLLKSMHLGKALLFYHFWFILPQLTVAVEGLVCADIFK